MLKTIVSGRVEACKESSLKIKGNGCELSELKGKPCPSFQISGLVMAGNGYTVRHPMH
jgi:hypothetical protein